MSGSGRTLAAMTSPELASASTDGSVLVVPIGSTEQHGPHLPLTTDADVASALVAGLVGLRPDVVAAPTLPYGASGEHEGFAGTLSIGTDAVEHVLVELCRSASTTFARVLIVSGHGGNAEAVAGALARVRAEGRDVRAWSPNWGGDAHAGRTETSLMLHLAPDRVVMDAAEAGDVRPLASIMSALRRDGVAGVSANGVLGDPSGASAEHGAALLDAAVSELAAFVDEWPRPGGR